MMWKFSVVFKRFITDANKWFLSARKNRRCERSIHSQPLVSVDSYHMGKSFNKSLRFFGSEYYKEY